MRMEVPVARLLIIFTVCVLCLQLARLEREHEVSSIIKSTTLSNCYGSAVRKGRPPSAQRLLACQSSHAAACCFSRAVYLPPPPSTRSRAVLFEGTPVWSFGSTQGEALRAQIG
jgi:hypothetical protein